MPVISHHREFERKVVKPGIIKTLHRIGARGEAISKQLISGNLKPELKAVDTSRLMNTLGWQVEEKEQYVGIGTLKPSPDGKSVHYAPYVFLGTEKMAPRPVLRTMLMILKQELK